MLQFAETYFVGFGMGLDLVSIDTLFYAIF